MKILFYLRRISILVVVMTLLLVVIFFVLSTQDNVKGFFPLPIFLQIQQIALPVIAISAWIFIPALFIVSTFIPEGRDIHRTVFLTTGSLVGIPFCCLFSYLALNLPETIFNSVQLGNYRYHFTVAAAFSDPWTIYTVYKCDVHDRNCETIYDDVGGASANPTYLDVDEATNQIHIFRRPHNAGILFYSYGTNPHSYEFESVAEIRGDYFTLYSFRTDKGKGFLLAECSGEDYTNFICAVFPFRYTTGETATGNLHIDENNEIQVFINQQLVYVHGNPPRCVAVGCVITDK